MNVPKATAPHAIQGGFNAPMTALALGLATAALGGPLQASGIVESSIQTSSRSGGSITTLTVTRGQPFYFSITAASTDTVIFRLSSGLAFPFTLGQLQGRPDNRIPWVLDRAPERLPDGRTRLFCRIDAAKTFAVNPGASLQVARGNDNIDTDPITVR